MKKETMELNEYLAANKARLELNIAIEADKATEIGKNKKLMDEALKALNEEIVKLEYERILATDNPVLTAITEVEIKICGTKVIKETKEYEFIDKMYVIDLLELGAKAKTAIFKNEQWKYWVEALNHAIFSNKIAGYEITKLSDRLDKFKISTVASTLELPNLDSLTNQTKAIQAILDAIIFTPYINKKGVADDTLNNYKVESRHVKILLDTFTNWSSKTATGVQFHTDKTFRQSLIRTFHSIVTKNAFVGE